MFTTITYRQGSERLSRAGCVARDWAAFWRLLHHRYPQTKKWGVMRVMELTKAGTPHFHLVVGTVCLSEIRCYGRVFRIGEYAAGFDLCECWSHRLGRVWAQVQKGESYIVHCVPVLGGAGAGGYMAKYLAKEMDVSRAATLGMVRRFSANRNWPREKRRRLKAPGGVWRRAVWKAGLVHTDDMEGLTKFDKTGGSKGKKADVKAAARRLIKEYGGQVGNRISSP